MNHKPVITETLHYVYSLLPKWCCAHFCYLFTELNSIYTVSQKSSHLLTVCNFVDLN